MRRRAHLRGSGTCVGDGASRVDMVGGLPAIQVPVYCDVYTFRLFTDRSGAGMTQARQLVAIAKGLV